MRKGMEHLEEGGCSRAGAAHTQHGSVLWRAAGPHVCVMLHTCPASQSLGTLVVVASKRMLNALLNLSMSRGFLFRVKNMAKFFNGRRCA